LTFDLKSCFLNPQYNCRVQRQLPKRHFHPFVPTHSPSFSDDVDLSITPKSDPGRSLCFSSIVSPTPLSLFSHPAHRKDFEHPVRFSSLVFGSPASIVTPLRTSSFLHNSSSHSSSRFPQVGVEFSKSFGFKKTFLGPVLVFHRMNRCLPPPPPSPPLPSFP